MYITYFKENVEKEKWGVGYPDDGVIWMNRPRKNIKVHTIHVNINLNRSAVIAKLIQYNFQSHWNLKENKTPLIIEDALKLMDILNLPKGINHES